MSWATLISVLFVNTVITAALGAFWYSLRGFGTLWIDYYYGGIRNFETRPKKHSGEMSMIITIMSVLVYNLFLIFLVNNIYSPRTLNDVILMSIMLTLVHFVLEVTHIAFENRSYMALFVHVGYHYFQTLLPLLMLRFFFNLPTVNLTV